MVAVIAPAGMPTRQWSAAIVGAVWPHTDPGAFTHSSEVAHEKGASLIGNAERTRSAAAGAAADQSGQTVDGFCDDAYRKAANYTGQADHFFSLSRMMEECARLTYGLREDLDRIDEEADAEIRALEESMKLGNSLLAVQQIMAIVAKARADATALGAAFETKVAAEGLKVGIQPPDPGRATGGHSGTNGHPGVAHDPMIRPASFGGGGRGPGNFPERMGAGIPAPEAPPDIKNPPPRKLGQHGDFGVTDDGPNPAEGDTRAGGPAGVGPADGGAGPGHLSRHGDFGVPGGDPPAFPFGGGGTPGGGGGGGTPSPLSSLGGFKMPEAPSSLSSLGGRGLPTQGLSSGLGGGVPSGASSLPSPVTPAATSTDFSRGLSSGLGGGPAPFVPPVQPPASTAMSAAPAGALSDGPAPVAAAAVGPAVSAAPAASMAGQGVPVGSSAGGMSAPVGPLPPFGSDVPRTPPVQTAAVSPAYGTPGAAPQVTSGAGSAPGPVTALPPGVVGSGVGAAAGAATEGIRASLPDPLLTSATALVYQLLHDSRMYPFMDWCVGVFRTSAGIETMIVNSEGCGYIPAGVFIPSSARMLFGDTSLSPDFRARWFSWANPAETMLAYAELATEHREDVELWALAVSTDDGGSSMPARALITQFEECSRSTSPLAEDAPTSALDDRHVHRLETMDRASYARLTGFGDGPLPDRSEAWRTTVAASQLALGRAGAIPDLAVAPAVRETLDLLGQGLPVPDRAWQDLETARLTAIMSGSGLRPGRAYSDGVASAYVRANHDVARLTELLLLWRLDGIAHPEIAYLAAQIQLSGG